MNSFQHNSRAAVFGATGGIGREVVKRLSQDSAFAQIYALSRSREDFQDAAITSLHADFDQPASIAEAAKAIGAEGPLDLVFIATGLLHRDTAVQPEKSLSEIDADAMSEIFRVNAIGPAIVARHFLPLLGKETKTVFAALSARVGSIADNRLGGWVSYRSSKAALNMILKTLAIEHARRNPRSVVAALHPGTVATSLSEPFSSNVPHDKLFTPERAARQLLDVIDGLSPEDSGAHFAWDGTRVPF